MSDRDVTTVVVAHRSGAHLHECLDALVDAGTVLVIDNASGDDGPAIAQARGCRVVENTHNIGFARAVNQAMQLTDTPFVLFVNPDAVVQPGAVDALRAALDEPAVGVVASVLHTPDGGEQRPDWPFPSAAGSWRDALGLHRLRPRPTRRDDQPYDVASVVGACMMLRREAWLAVGGFDERFWLYGEETDFCARLAHHGWRRQLVPAAVAVHEGGASGSEVAAQHFLHGTDRFVLHHHGRTALVLHRTAVLLGSAVRLPLLWLRPCGRSDPRRAVRARAVRHCAHTLARHPFTVPTEPLADVDEVVLCSLEQWDDTWRRNQLFVRELVTDRERPTRVLFVEPPLDVVHHLRTHHRLARRHATLPVPCPGQPGVFTFRPRKVWPRVLGGAADRSLAKQLTRAAANVGMAKPVLWVNDSTYANLLQPCRHWPSVYDITDDWLHERVPARELARRQAREAVLLCHADRVVVCSPSLAESRSSPREVTLVSNAVDVGHFRRPRARPTDLPAAPVAVYVGTLHRERLDLDLVEGCAANMPWAQVVLVGPNALDDAEQARLTAHANITLLGARPYADVPAYVQHADVVIVPHVVTPFTDSLDPIKLYECRAVGTPTLATPVAGFRTAGPPIAVASPAEFADRLADLLRHPPPARPDDTVPTWHDQAQRFRDELDAARTNHCESFHVVYLGHTAKRSGGELALVRMLGGLTHIHRHVILGEDGPLVELLRATGATVEVLAMTPSTREVHRDSITLRRLPVARVLDAARYAWRVRCRLRELQPDLVHTNTLKAALYGGVAGRLAKVPVVWHVRDRIADDYLPAGTARFVRLVGRRVPAAIIANSVATLDTLGTLYRPSKVVPSPVVYDAVHTVEPFPPRPVNGKVRVGLVGRLAPWKGQHVFLRAFAQAQLPEASMAVLVGSAMFGEDDYAESLHTLCQELGIARRVQFLGFVDDVNTVLAHLDLLVHASVIPEPFGQVVVEGMAAGLPVIAAAAGGPQEVITDGVDGLLTAPGDVDALAAAIEALAADPTLRARIGSAGRQRAQDFTPEVVARQVESLYLTVVSAGSVKR